MMQVLLGMLGAVIVLIAFVGGYVFAVKSAKPKMLQVSDLERMGYYSTGGGDPFKQKKPKKKRNVDYRHPIRGSRDIEDEEEEAEGMDKYKTDAGLYEPVGADNVVAKERD